MGAVVVRSSEGGKCRVARRLHAAGATSAWSAQSFEPRNHLERRGLEAGLASGLVVRTEAGTYFVNPERYEAMRVRQRWSIIVAVAAVLIGLAVLYLTGELTS
jgi:predicted NAD/FAD-dependent oxidoreductase